MKTGQVRFSRFTVLFTEQEGGWSTRLQIKEDSPVHSTGACITEPLIKLVVLIFEQCTLLSMQYTTIICGIMIIIHILF